jgi:acetyl-CoA carboxylase carboxyl transferase alpha subunit
MMGGRFFELRGDGTGFDDPSVMTVLAEIGDHRVALAANDKGRGAAGRRRCNFGMPLPEGYRKARRLFRLAEKLSLPVVCLVDTPGAMAGPEAESRGQARSISRNLAALLSLSVPVLAAFIGEGGSGGALALGIGDTVLMMENAVFSVISPEGCASILWKEASLAPRAASLLRLTARDLRDLGLVDAVVPEPPGGAHRDPQAVAVNLKGALEEHLELLEALPPEVLRSRRRRRYLELTFYERKVETGAAETSLP